jgi:hypothetical protein
MTKHIHIHLHSGAKDDDAGPTRRQGKTRGEMAEGRSQKMMGFAHEKGIKHNESRQRMIPPKQKALKHSVGRAMEIHEKSAGGKSLKPHRGGPRAHGGERRERTPWTPDE